jgi:hypothetical protein
MKVGRGHHLHVAESGVTGKAGRLVGGQQAQPGMSGCGGTLGGTLQDRAKLRWRHLDGTRVAEDHHRAGGERGGRAQCRRDRRPREVHRHAEHRHDRWDGRIEARGYHLVEP